MIEGAHHYGVTVSDLDRSIAFYQDTLGLEVSITDRLEGEGIGQQVGLEGTILKLAHLNVEGCLLELLEYEQPKGGNRNPETANNDVGAAHFCIEVSNINDLYAELEDDVEFLSEPATLENGAVGVYLLDPDRNPLELLELP